MSKTFLFGLFYLFLDKLKCLDNSITNIVILFIENYIVRGTVDLPKRDRN